MPVKQIRKKNAGFSLVELIIVIAIMATLVGVLAPQFIKYVENSRRALDVSNANEIREAIVVLKADGVDFPPGRFQVESSPKLLEILPEGQIPVLKSNVSGNAGQSFYAEIDSYGVCNVYTGNTEADFNLTTHEGSEDYLNYGR